MKTWYYQQDTSNLTNRFWDTYLHNLCQLIKTAESEMPPSTYQESVADSAETASQVMQ